MNILKRRTESYVRPLQRTVPDGTVRKPPLRLLQAALVGLDHLLDHLAADGAGLTGGQVAVVAFLQVDADLP